MEIIIIVLLVSNKSWFFAHAAKGGVININNDDPCTGIFYSFKKNIIKIMLPSIILFYNKFSKIFLKFIRETLWFLS